MRQIIFIILMLLVANIAIANPFSCGALIFDNNTACNTYCQSRGSSCNNMEKDSKNVLSCNSGKYRGFIYSNGMTYAVTSEKVSWYKEKNAKIRNARDNQAIASLLKSLNIDMAWIDGLDINMSGEYEVVNGSRFQTRDYRALKYYNWKPGEPNNHWDALSYQRAPIMGEHWVAIDSNGYWQDLGYNSDGSERKLYAVVEFNGQLSCVSGQVVSSATKNMVEPGFYCPAEEGIDIFKTDLDIEPVSCTAGIIFNTDSEAYFCNQDKKSCNQSDKITTKNDKFLNVLPWGGGNKRGYYITGMSRTTGLSFGEGGLGRIVGECETSSYYVKDNALWHSYSSGDNVRAGYEPGYEPGYLAGDYSSTDPSAPKFYCVWKESREEKIADLSTYIPNSCQMVDSNLITNGYYGYFLPDGMRGFGSADLEVTLECKEPVYTCPYTNRPCVSDGAGYSCSPRDCVDSSNENNYSENPSATTEGENDPDNNGTRDENGICTANVQIFPGHDSRCEQLSVIGGRYDKGNANCCHKITVPDTVEDPDMTLIPDKLRQSCTSSEQQLMLERGQNACVYIGSYCHSKFINKCKTRKQTYCCYDSEFNRAFAEAGVDLLGRSFGVPEHPICAGFSPEEIKKLNVMGITNHPKMKEFAEKLSQESEAKAEEMIKNLGGVDGLKQEVELQVKEYTK